MRYVAALWRRQCASRLHGLGAWRRHAGRHAGRDAGGGAERQSGRPRPRADRSRAPDRRLGARAVRLSRKAPAACSSPARRMANLHRPCWWRAPARWAARCAATGWARRRRSCAPMPRAAAHGCVPQAMELAGLGADALRLIPAGRRSPHGHCRAARGDRRGPRGGAGRRSWSSASAGTVDVGAIDDLDATGRRLPPREALVSRRRRLGALGVLSPRVRAAAARASSGPIPSPSISTNGARCPTTPASCWCATASCIARPSPRPPPICAARRGAWPPAAPWPCDFGPDLSRGFRALKTWFTLQVLRRRRAWARPSPRTCALARAPAKRACRGRAEAGAAGAGAAQHRLLPLPLRRCRRASMPNRRRPAGSRHRRALHHRRSAASWRSAPPCSTTAPRPGRGCAGRGGAAFWRTEVW